MGKPSIIMIKTGGPNRLPPPAAAQMARRLRMGEIISNMKAMKHL